MVGTVDAELELTHQMVDSAKLQVRPLPVRRATTPRDDLPPAPLRFARDACPPVVAAAMIRGRVFLRPVMDNCARAGGNAANPMEGASVFSFGGRGRKSVLPRGSPIIAAFDLDHASIMSPRFDVGIVPAFAKRGQRGNGATVLVSGVSRPEDRLGRG
jgi:hypothetical protein